jgi:hypothetical protein
MLFSRSIAAWQSCLSNASIFVYSERCSLHDSQKSLKPRLELGTQTHDALRPACRTSSGLISAACQLKQEVNTTNSALIYVNVYKITTHVQIWIQFEYFLVFTYNTEEVGWLYRHALRSDTFCYILSISRQCTSLFGSFRGSQNWRGISILQLK